MDRNVSAFDVLAISAVALRKESVDRNTIVSVVLLMYSWSLSARRAWIEISLELFKWRVVGRRSPQGERG